MRPRFSMYWSFDEGIGLPLVRSLRSRNKFRKTKTYLHCCDNTNLDEIIIIINLFYVDETVKNFYKKKLHCCSNTRIRYANLSQLPYLKTKIKF